MAEPALNAALTKTSDFCGSIIFFAANAPDDNEPYLREVLQSLADYAIGLKAEVAIAQAQATQAPHPPKGAWTPWGFMPAQPDFHASNDHSPVPPSPPE